MKEHTSKKILVIDDEEYALELLSISLRDEGFDAFTAQTGQDAINKLEQGNPDLIIMDVQMPGTDTLGLLHKIKERRHMLPVITYTGFDYRPELADWKHGTNAFIVKSSDLNGLIKQVKKLLA
ncbi:MAG: response regulator [Dissulfurispiraceae bacterium]|jgi:DNA-binding NtrC family response regulator